MSWITDLLLARSFSTWQLSINSEAQSVSVTLNFLLNGSCLSPGVCEPKNFLHYFYFWTFLVYLVQWSPFNSHIFVILVSLYYYNNEFAKQICYRCRGQFIKEEVPILLFITSKAFIKFAYFFGSTIF